MSQSHLLEFVSDAFPVVPGEDAATNPGLFGRALAEWLCARLGEKGLPVDDVVAEDFGWCVPVACLPYRGYVVCCSADDESTVFSNEWRVFAFVEGGLMSRLMGRDGRPAALAALFGTVKSCLIDAPEIERLEEA